MSELSQTEKNEISHRGRAVRMLLGHLAGEATPGAR
jgi:inosine/xanthosine triphosphate pyrophosphatase family protein